MFVTILLCVFLSSALLAQNSQQEPKTEPKPTATEPKPVAASGASRTGPGGTDTNDEVARFLIDMTRQWLEANITHDSRIRGRLPEHASDGSLLDEVRRNRTRQEPQPGRPDYFPLRWFQAVQAATRFPILYSRRIIPAGPKPP